MTNMVSYILGISNPKIINEREVLRLNGYAMVANCCRLMLSKGEMTKEEAEKKILVYDFLATCDIDDLCEMVDSSAFYEIIEAFLKMALCNANIDKKSQARVLEEFRWIFNNKKTKEVLNNG